MLEESESLRMQRDDEKGRCHAGRVRAEGRGAVFGLDIARSQDILSKMKCDYPRK